ncbi:MAG: TfoX/Sxy family protein [Pirellulales bacterium]|nr:TfoX/Sxy family protein [Pirellulales bacterium]
MDLTELPNIGATVANRLRGIGIDSLDDLKRVGAVQAYAMMKEQNEGKTLPVCYYLYSLQGAITGVHWDALGQETKDELRRKAESLAE